MQPYAMARPNLTGQKAPLPIGTNTYLADIANGVVLERGAAGERRLVMEEAMGGKNVYYFLTPFARGRWQVLPVGYDLRRKEWFDVAASAMRHFGREPDEALHWTETPYTFNTACFSCHVSQLTNNYRVQTDTYQTSWAEPGINCETCHGPAAEHIRVARQTPKGLPLADLKLIGLRKTAAEPMNSLCGACHAKMYPLTNSFSPGDRFFDDFGLAALEQADFYPDGRDLGENFTFTSWRLNPCVKGGQLDCVKCHTSSGRNRFPGEKADMACLPCHEEKVSHAAAHSHHQAGTEGARCVACHMPMTEFARMRRSDHSFRPPMPAATLAFGSPNACNLCHTNQTAAWADQQVRQWHPHDYQAPTLLRAGWIAAARRRDWTRLPEMVRYLASPGREEIWASSLLELLSGCEDEAKWEGVKPCLKDPSPLVRAAAAQALGQGLRPEFIPLLAAAARDDSRLVRLRAAAALAGAPPETIPGAGQAAVSQATEELLGSFLARPDDAGSYYNLGNFRLERREYDAAIQAFTTANRLQPRDVSPWSTSRWPTTSPARTPKPRPACERRSGSTPPTPPSTSTWECSWPKWNGPQRPRPPSAPPSTTMRSLRLRPLIWGCCWPRPGPKRPWPGAGAPPSCVRRNRSTFTPSPSTSTAWAAPPRRRARWKSSSHKALQPPRPTRCWAGFTKSNASPTRPSRFIAERPKTANSPARNALSSPSKSAGFPHRWPGREPADWKSAIQSRFGIVRSRGTL